MATMGVITDELFDKLCFVGGVFTFSLVLIIIAKYPLDFFYNFYRIFVPVAIFSRFVYYWTRGWHFFLCDFCYYSSFIVVAFVGFFPKNQYFYRLAFFYASGPLAVSTAAFFNALVFHKPDSMINLVMHPLPLACMWNVKQVTMKYEKYIPEAQRYFT